MTNNWVSELRNAFKFLHANKEFDFSWAPMLKKKVSKISNEWKSKQ